LTVYYIGVHTINIKLKRRYQQTLRDQKAAETDERIVVEAERLFSTEPFDRVTLAAVAEAAGVTIPTLQRRFGNKEGVFAAFGDHVRARVQQQRGAPPVGVVRACLAELMAHYEAEGRMMWHLLRQEQDVPMLKQALDEGRAFHRAWVESVFADVLARESTPKARRARADALVAVTDLFVWKLLRLDLGRSRAEVDALITAMAEAVAGGG